MSRTSLTRQKARGKGLKSAGALAATIFLAIWMTPWIVVLGLPVTGYFTYDWLKFRGVHGLRF